MIEFEPREPQNQTVVAFLPSVLMVGKYLGNRILRCVEERGLGVLAIEIPAKTVQATPRGTREAMDEVYDLVSERVCSRQLASEQMIVVGESIGCCQASRFAAKMGTKRLSLALPGSKLAECIFESYTTRGEKREAQRRVFQLADYQQALQVYDPILYVPRISGYVAIQVATHDIMIPSRRGFELLEEFEKEAKWRGNLNVQQRVYQYCDHSSGAFRFAWEFGSIVDTVMRDNVETRRV